MNKRNKQLLPALVQSLFRSRSMARLQSHLGKEAISIQPEARNVAQQACCAALALHVIACPVSPEPGGCYQHRAG